MQEVYTDHENKQPDLKTIVKENIARIVSISAENVNYAVDIPNENGRYWTGLFSIPHK